MIAERISLNGVGLGETPAQASPGTDFVTDVPVQGPTDEGMREADCRFVQTMLPADPACVDCKGPIPMWAQTNGLLGEQIALGGVGVRGFALSAVGDPEVWTKLNADQQAWVRDALVKLNAKIVATTKTTCPTFGPSISAAGGCFQQWFNGAFTGAASLTKADGTKLVLRTDGVFDQDTLDALVTVAGLYGKDFQAPFPGSTTIAPVEEKGLSKGAMYGLAAGGVVLVGGIIYYVTRK